MYKHLLNLFIKFIQALPHKSLFKQFCYQLMSIRSIYTSLLRIFNLPLHCLIKYAVKTIIILKLICILTFQSKQTSLIQ